MAIKCGRGNHYHDDVAGVRACYNGQSPATATFPKAESKPLSEGQVRLVHVCLKAVNAEYTGNTPLESLDRYGAGRVLLDGLVKAKDAKKAGQSFTLPADTKPKTNNPSVKGVRSSEPLPDVAQGYYATSSLTENSDLDFWFIRRNPKTGFKKVKRVIGGHPDTDVRGKTAREALEAIVKLGEEKAGQLYAEHIGQCCKCNRHLTKYASRKLGRGRTCAEKSGMGALWDQIEAQAPMGYYEAA